MNQTIELNLDKSHWKLVKFGEIASQQKKTIDRENTNLTRYVKGEHMGSEDLHLREWGELTNEYLGPAFIRKFEEGDILYGSRRTYLRKVVLSPFNGITSNTTFVIKSHEKIINKNLLPYVMLSEGFAQHSIRNSKGSVNPYVNWKDLTSYEFLLPPLDEQEAIKNLLCDLDSSIETDRALMRKLVEQLQSTENGLYNINLNGKTISEAIRLHEKISHVETIGNLGRILKGKGVSKADVLEEGLPCIRYGELYTTHHKHIREYRSYISESSANEALQLKRHDVLFASSGETISEIGKSAAFVKDELCFAGSDILVFRPNNMDGTYLGYLMNSNLVRQQLNKLGTGATVMHIYASDLAKIKIPVIARELQDKIGQELEQIQSCIYKLKIKIENSRLLQKSLINKIF